MSNRQRLTQLVQWIVTLAVAGAIIAVLYSRRDELAAVWQLTPALLAAVSITALLQFVTNGLVRIASSSRSWLRPGMSTAFSLCLAFVNQCREARNFVRRTTPRGAAL